MKKITLLIAFLIPLICVSQSNQEIIKRYLNTNSAKSGLSSDDVKDWIIQSEGSSSATNINSCYVLQRYQGIEIFRAVSNFSIKDGQIVNAEKRFVSNLSRKVNAVKPSLTAINALTKAYAFLGLAVTAPFSIVEVVSQYKSKITSGLGVDETVSANLVYHVTKENNLMLAWDFIINTVAHDHVWSVRIDALNGNILEKNDYNISCNFHEQKSTPLINSFNSLVGAIDTNYKQLFSPIESAATGGSYRVVPFNVESPNHGPRALISDPASSKASPYGWHDTNGISGAEFTTTRGNNVWAKADLTAENLNDGSSPEGGSSLVFDFPYEGTTVDAASYINAANTNLFYMNNVMHDIWYHYGFDEENGNFQQNNYGKKGQSKDFVYADAQDGSRANPQNTNNANFYAPRDGTSGRMQMFLWNYGPEIKPIIVNSPASIAGSFVARQNSFNPGRVDLPVSPALLQSNLVLYLDSAGSSDGCSAPANAAAMNGKIVILRRGSCTFVVKTKAAQDAGAIAVIIVNNTAGTITMSGADATISIPSISVTQSVGEAIISKMATEAVNVKLQLEGSPFVNSDGDFDNGIIAHEYGHGISIRLAGGANNSNCLDNTDQMGEGWSDWIALMMQIKPGDSGAAKRSIGTFVTTQPTDGPGIRDYPYSTDRAINPTTFADTNKYQYTDEDMFEKTEVHGTGAVWAAVLWDLTWAYINKYAYDDNKYTGSGGNNKLMRIVLEGIKLQPCSPTFISARNAIIAADQAITGGKDYCMIWEVFAARGLGVNASAGDGNVGNDQVEDFTRPSAGPNCVLAVTQFENDNFMNVYPNPSDGDLTVRVNQFIGKVNIQVLDVTGRVVFSVENEDFSNEIKLNLSHLGSGIYILKVNGDGLNYIEKIILN